MRAGVVEEGVGELERKMHTSIELGFTIYEAEFLTF
jgi:hypothetical protein